MGLQLYVAPLISIKSVSPDFVLLGLVLFAVREGQIPAALAGFLVGIFFDLYLGDTVGISSLSKTIAGFTAGYFYHEDRRDLLPRTPRFVWIFFLAACMHNVFYMFVYFRTVQADAFKIILLHGFGAAVYSSVFAAVFVLIYSRRASGFRL